MLNSSILGSIIIKRKVFGELRYKRLKSIEFIPTLLPLPVVPAMSKCGSFLRSVTKALPTISLPKAMVKGLLAFLKTSLCKFLLNKWFEFHHLELLYLQHLFLVLELEYGLILPLKP